jgi:hypothetical protein
MAKGGGRARQGTRLLRMRRVRAGSGLAFLDHRAHGGHRGPGLGGTLAAMQRIAGLRQTVAGRREGGVRAELEG